jgi:formylglycine-generating enzyme required for sulfatase activity
MSHRSPIPVIFLAFADNDPRLPTLPYLASEANQLIIILEDAQARGACEVVVRPGATLEDIINVFRNSRYGERVAVFHYAGHADENGLLLKTAHRDEAGASMRGLGPFLAQQRGLKLVFLNACNTGAHAAALQEFGVLAVVATTSDPVHDKMACHFAELFYQGLASGRTMDEAFTEARAVYATDGCVDGPEGCPWLLCCNNGTAEEWTLCGNEPRTTANRVQSSAAELPKALEKLPFDWVTIPAGRFTYGEGPDTRSRYAGAFAIGRAPVTNREYEAFVCDRGYHAPAHWRGSAAPPARLDHPVVNISLADAHAFCTWAGVRLPNELEWEKAARGLDGRVYPWGNEPPQLRNCNAGRVCTGTTPVTQCLAGASPFGCVDMAGNVWEWTDTPWQIGGLRQSSLGTPARRYVVRGGSFRDGCQFARCCSRLDESETCATDNLGFRVAKSLA